MNNIYCLTHLAKDFNSPEKLSHKETWTWSYVLTIWVSILTSQVEVRFGSHSITTRGYQNRAWMWGGHVDWKDCCCQNLGRKDGSWDYTGCPLVPGIWLTSGSPAVRVLYTQGCTDDVVVLLHGRYCNTVGSY